MQSKGEGDILDELGWADVERGGRASKVDQIA